MFALLRQFTRESPPLLLGEPVSFVLDGMTCVLAHGRSRIFVLQIGKDSIHPPAWQEGGGGGGASQSPWLLGGGTAARDVCALRLLISARPHSHRHCVGSLLADVG